ncbi:MAG TPA: L,D-transpeptidase [Solirubrobacteraceae bacterium]|nr:L,D-transpeptidase [Solirubrobacteraceae bacterium]
MELNPRRAAAALVLALLMLALPPAALAETAPPPAPIVPAAPGKVIMSLVKVGGAPPFSMVGHRITVRGVVIPYVGGQQAKVSFYRDGRKVAVQVRNIRALGTGNGEFTASYVSSAPGLVEARVAHYLTPLQAQFTGRAPAVRYVQVNLGPGASGPSVRLLQSELSVLHYAVPLSGTFDEGTGRALVAYRKMTGLERVPYAGRHVFELLAHRAGRFHVRYRSDGRHVEANLTKQVLAEIEPGGRIHAIYTMSSGKPSTPTVVGRFRVYSKTPGINEKGMVDSNYFIRGYAIHGYAEVPTYAASHGCLRVPVPNAASIFGWVQYGTPVDVYNQEGGGSRHVRGNAGP